jgi:hypothetical protein
VATPPPGFAGAHPGYGSERKRAANRVNARRSTGPRSTAGKARVASNALRHGLNVAVADDPLLTEDVERLARAICDGVGRGGARSAPSAPVGRNKRKRIAPFRTQEAQCAALIAPYELAYLARRVAEAQVDLMRVRRARHAMMTRALDNPRYRSPRYLRRQIAMLVAVGELLVRGIAVPDDMRKAAFGRPQGALKFALVIADLAHELARFERYERRALSRRKAAVAAFDAACAGQGAPALIELPAIQAPPDQEARCWRNKATAGAPGGIPSPACGGGRRDATPCAIVLPDQEARCWRNKATATAASDPAGTVRAWGDRPMVSYREAAFYVCQPLDIDRPLRLDLPRDGPPTSRAQCGSLIAPFEPHTPCNPALLRTPGSPPAGSG